MPITFTQPEDYDVDCVIKVLTRAALMRCDGNRTQAAALLNVSIRTLRNWIRLYGLAKEMPPTYGKRK